MKQSSKRLISMLFVLVFLVAALVGFFDFVQPAYTDIGQLRGQAIAQGQLLDTLTTTVKQAQSLISSYQNQGSDVTGIALALPAGQDLAGALTQLGGIAAANGLTVTSIAVSTPTLRTKAATAAGTATAPGAPAAATPQAAKPAGSFSLKITATGNYQSFKNFLTGLEANIRLFDIQNISLQPVTDGAVAGKGRTVSVDYFTYNIVAQTYYQAQ